MTRFLKRLVFALLTLGLGALAYALLRAEGERSFRPVRPDEADEADEAGGAPPPEDREPVTAAPEAADPEPAEPAAAPRQCAGHTKSGKRCARAAEPGSDYCWQHAG